MRLELGSARDQLQVLKSRKRYKLDVENKLAQSMVINIIIIIIIIINNNTGRQCKTD